MAAKSWVIRAQEARQNIIVIRRLFLNRLHLSTGPTGPPRSKVGKAHQKDAFFLKLISDAAELIPYSKCCNKKGPGADRSSDPWSMQMILITGTMLEPRQMEPTCWNEVPVPFVVAHMFQIYTSSPLVRAW